MLPESVTSKNLLYIQKSAPEIVEQESKCAPSHLDLKIDSLTSHIPGTPSSVAGELKVQGGPLLSFLRTETLEMISNRLKNLDVTKQSYNSFVHSIQEGKVQTQINQESFPYILLQSFLNKEINQFQFATSLYFRSAILEARKKTLQILHLFDGTLETQKIARSTLNLTDQQFAEWLEKMKRAPLSEHYFLAITRSRDDHLYDQIVAQSLGGTISPEDRHSIPISTILRFYQNFNTFGVIKGLNNSTYQLTPSFSMMQAYLDVKYGKNALQMHPIIGVPSNKSLMLQQLKDKRAVSLPFPEIVFPNSADTFSATRSQFIKHDFFHLEVSSAIPKPLRDAYLELAEFVHKGDITNPIHSYLFSLLVDFDFSYFLLEDQKTLTDLSFHFWLMLEFIFDTILKNKQNDPQIHPGIGIAKEIAKHLSQNKERWAEQYGITFEEFNKRCDRYENQRINHIFLDMKKVI